MKKNVVIVLLIITTALSLMYAFDQKTKVDRLLYVSEENARMVERLQIETEEQKKMAEEQAARLRIVLEDAQTKLAASAVK